MLTTFSTFLCLTSVDNIFVSLIFLLGMPGVEKCGGKERGGERVWERGHEGERICGGEGVWVRGCVGERVCG